MALALGITVSWVVERVVLSRSAEAARGRIAMRCMWA
jgi:hypothetical protein